MKNGFTLIELMVVIVIMGVLAAIAVPRLFGQIAKSKASEVPTAAGAWINLQDAYASERLDIGSWVDIGYIAPGKFVNSSAYDSKVISYSGTGGTWVASPREQLNNCLKDQEDAWKLEASGVNDKGLIKIETSGNEDCLALTPSFESFSRATAR